MTIYAALMSLVASLIDVCHFDRVLRMLAAYINWRGQTQDSYRPAAAMPHSLSLGISTVFGTAGSELCLSTAAVAFIIDLDPSDLHDLRATRLKRPIDRMFYGCQIQLLQYSKWFAPSCASPSTFFPPCSGGTGIYKICRNKIVVVSRLHAKENRKKLSVSQAQIKKQPMPK